MRITTKDLDRAIDLLGQAAREAGLDRTWTIQAGSQPNGVPYRLFEESPEFSHPISTVIGKTAREAFHALTSLRLGFQVVANQRAADSTRLRNEGISRISLGNVPTPLLEAEMDRRAKGGTPDWCGIKHGHAAHGGATLNQCPGIPFNGPRIRAAKR